MLLYLGSMVGKVQILDQLKKRGFSLTSRYPLCRKVEESIEHLFLHCPKVWSLLVTHFSLIGGGWACSFQVKDLILGCVRLLLGQRKKKLYKVVFLCLLWIIQIERNKVNFEDITFSLDTLKSFFFFKYLYARASLIP